MLVLLVLIDPLGEISLDERRLHLVLGDTRPVLDRELLLANDEVERAVGEAFARVLEKGGVKSAFDAWMVIENLLRG